MVLMVEGMVKVVSAFAFWKKYEGMMSTLFELEEPTLLEKDLKVTVVRRVVSANAY